MTAGNWKFPLRDVSPAAGRRLARRDDLVVLDVDISASPASSITAKLFDSDETSAAEATKVVKNPKMVLNPKNPNYSSSVAAQASKSASRVSALAAQKTTTTTTTTTTAHYYQATSSSSSPSPTTTTRSTTTTTTTRPTTTTTSAAASTASTCSTASSSVASSTPTGTVYSGGIATYFYQGGNAGNCGDVNPGALPSLPFPPPQQD